MRPEKEKGSVGRNDGENQKSGKHGGVVGVEGEAALQYGCGEKRGTRRA